jgi:hypothetical protein
MEEGEVGGSVNKTNCQIIANAFIKCSQWAKKAKISQLGARIESAETDGKWSSHQITFKITRRTQQKATWPNQSHKSLKIVKRCSVVIAAVAKEATERTRQNRNRMVRKGCISLAGPVRTETQRGQIEAVNRWSSIISAQVKTKHEKSGRRTSKFKLIPNHMASITQETPRLDKQLARPSL